MENTDKSANWNSRDKNILDGNKERPDVKKENNYKTQQYKLNRNTQGKKLKEKMNRTLLSCGADLKLLIYT